MMSNYQRTMELTGYATNSAGASQKQFEKTMESLESKLNRLHNAWENFTTGIAKASTIKGAVDLLTALLTVINKITEATDPAHTGITKILAAILGFKAAKGIVNGVLRNIGTQIATGMGTNGDKAATSFFNGFKNKISPLMSKNKIFKIETIGTQLKSEAASLNTLSSAYSEYGNTLNKIEQAKRAGLDTSALEQQAMVQLTSIRELSNKAGLEETTIDFENATANSMEATATDLSAKAKAKETAATNLLNTAEASNKGIASANIKTKAIALLQLFSTDKAKKLNAMSTLGLASAEEVEAISATGAAGCGFCSFIKCYRNR